MADRSADVYDHFYRCLTVQHVLQHIRRNAVRNGYISRREQKTRKPHFKKEENLWHIFLDSLSILCDHKTGGETVTSIAAELDRANEGKTTFWILVNRQHSESKSTLRASDHLKDLMDRLHVSACAVQADESLMLESFCDSVFKARDRVNNYRKKLQGRIAALEDRGTELSSEEHLLVKAINTLIDENKTVETLCKKAYDFRSTGSMRKLSKRARKDPTDEWKHIGHFIGRLGAWFKACLFLFEHASDFLDILSNYEVQLVPSEDYTRFASPQSMWDLQRLLSKTLPTHFDVSKARLEHLFGQDAWEVANSRLKECEATGWRLKTHAEASMAYFFLIEDRQFVNEDRYIGCSKPSCMCCALYLEALSGILVQRPRSGNAWIQWRLPGPSLSTSASAIAIMQRMADRLQRDIEIELISASEGHVFTYDSSTNISSVLGRSSMQNQ